MPQPNVFTSEGNIIEMYKHPTIEGKQYLEAPELQKVAQQVMNNKNIEIKPAQVGYMLVYPNISTLTASKTVKASALVTHYSGNNFIVMISGELWDMLDQETRETLVWHQLLHIDARYNEKSREWKYSLRKHDYSDFYEILKSEGARWYQVVQSVMSSLYDLDPRQESKVKI